MGIIKPFKNAYGAFVLIIFLGIAVAAQGCGRKGPPLPPESKKALKLAERVYKTTVFSLILKPFPDET